MKGNANSVPCKLLLLRIMKSNIEYILKNNNEKETYLPRVSWGMMDVDDEARLHEKEIGGF